MASFFHKLTSNTFKTAEESKLTLSRLLSIFKRRSKKKSTVSPYIITNALKDDHHHILKLMHESYYRNEPTLRSLGIKQNPALDEAIMKSLREGLTLVARCKYDGCITGACINQSSQVWDPDVKERLACSIQCPKVRSLLLFQAYLQRLPDLWECYDIQRIFEISHLFVHPEHKEQELELRLMKQSKILAADCGFKLIRCNATTAQVVELCQDLEMIKIGEIAYKSYLGRDFKPLFDPPHPDTAVKVYIEPEPQLWSLNNAKR